MNVFHKKEILILEDDAIMAKFISNLLEGQGFKQLYFAKNLKEAYAIIDQHKISFAILDICLQNQQKGYEIGNFIRKNNLFPFIYISSDVDFEDYDFIKSSKPDCFLSKPFKGIDFVLNITVVFNKYYDESLLDFELNSDNTPFYLLKCLDFIHCNVLEKIEIKDLANLINCSEGHVHKVFKKYLNVTPHYYITKIKMQKGKELLLNTSLSIQDISYDLQYTSRSNFTKNFKTFFGYSPYDLRRKNK